MATTTTNYGFDIPQSTDLVKDGATAIATLGQDIDTAMNTALGTKKAGMVLLNTTSFSAVSSVSLAADTFSSTYDNYKILFRVTSSGGAGYIQMRFRAAGTDNSNPTYDSQGLGRQVNAVTTSFESGNDTFFYITPKNTGDTLATSIDVFSPKLTNNTIINGLVQAVANGTSTSTNFSLGGTFKATTSFDSLTFISSVSTITGAYSVYGYNK